MWSRPLSALLSTFLWSTQAFLVPLFATGRGEIRCRSPGYPQQQPPAQGRRPTIAAATRGQRQERTSATSAMSDNTGSCDRKGFLSDLTRNVAGAGLAAITLGPNMAVAKQAADSPVDWTAEFGSVKKATDLVLKDLKTLATDGDWEQLMEQAKGYDQSIRKGLMGDVRKKMPKEIKGDAMTYRNNITFDLIAINKAARVEDRPRTFEVLDILEADINGFLNLQKRI
ncbi:expressed unknown protein [Ectocarpus siliculosus]|uniref:Uncharacterized protein n=1 Tax=Ectocarpus siliculosus TaxID=2880 RepID=D8LSP3_ECTSI|nr:expressed unknown protein [Ectocarpus siliculosus]|eukprot:CBN75243.1 expressed unknown protein [Ectocarpus siliculosus]